MRKALQASVCQRLHAVLTFDRGCGILRGCQGFGRFFTAHSAPQAKHSRPATRPQKRCPAPGCRSQARLTTIEVWQKLKDAPRKQGTPRFWLALSKRAFHFGASDAECLSSRLRVHKTGPQRFSKLEPPGLEHLNPDNGSP